MQRNPENEGRTTKIPHCSFLETATSVADYFFILILSAYINIQSHIRFKSSTAPSSMLFPYFLLFSQIPLPGPTMVTANIKGFLHLGTDIV